MRFLLSFFSTPFCSDEAELLLKWLSSTLRLKKSIVEAFYPHSSKLASAFCKIKLSALSTILEIESALQKLPLAEVRQLQDWIVDYLRLSETSLERSVTDTWEKLGPSPDVEYDKI